MNENETKHPIKEPCKHRERTLARTARAVYHFRFKMLILLIAFSRIRLHHVWLFRSSFSVVLLKIKLLLYYSPYSIYFITTTSEVRFKQEVGSKKKKDSVHVLELLDHIARFNLAA